MNKIFVNFLAMLAAEFHLYLMEHGKSIPTNSLVVFEVQGEDDFNKWHKKLSLRNRESKQPVVRVEVKKWRRHSSFEKVLLKRAV